MPLALPSNAKDMLRQVSGDIYNLPPAIDTSKYSPTIDKAMGLFDTGLDPSVMTALEGEAMSGVQKRYDQAASNLRTTLLQRGAYGGQLPVDSGAVLRGFGPLESDMAQATSAAGRQAVLANQNALLQNRQLALNALGMGTQIDLSNYNAKAQSLDELLKSAQELGNLESTSTKNIIMASLLGAGTKALSDPKNFAKMVTMAKSGLSHIPGLSGVFGASAAPVAGGAGAAAAAAAGTSEAAMFPGLAAIQAGAVPSISGSAIGVNAAAGHAAGISGGTGMGAQLASFFTNPITIGVGAAIAGAIIWKKSQVHPSADKFVQTYQNPFGDHLNHTLDEFWKAASSGNLTQSQGQAIKSQIASLVAGFEHDMDQFAAKGSHERTVANQARNFFYSNWYGQNWSGLMSGLDATIAQLPQEVAA